MSLNPTESEELPPYTVVAHNTSSDSENKIHDDAVARRFGFGGGLVPGVDVYAYMAHLPVALWGRAWLARGAVLEVRARRFGFAGSYARVVVTGLPHGVRVEHACLPPTSTIPVPCSRYP